MNMLNGSVSFAVENVCNAFVVARLELNLQTNGKEAPKGLVSQALRAKILQPQRGSRTRAP